jgi:hypothetical protein
MLCDALVTKNSRHANREMIQETERENCEQRGESGERNQNGENLKDCAGDFLYSHLRAEYWREG